MTASPWLARGVRVPQPASTWLATQNPVDLDYSALSNAGIWCIGRLQTDADRERVVDGRRLSWCTTQPVAASRPAATEAAFIATFGDGAGARQVV